MEPLGYALVRRPGAAGLQPARAKRLQERGLLPALPIAVSRSARCARGLPAQRPWLLAVRSVVPTLSGAGAHRLQRLFAGRALLLLCPGTSRLRPRHRSARRHPAGPLPARPVYVRGLQRGHLPALRRGLLLRPATATLVAGRPLGIACRRHTTARSGATAALPDGLGHGLSGRYQA